MNATWLALMAFASGCAILLRLIAGSQGYRKAVTNSALWTFLVGLWAMPLLQGTPAAIFAFVCCGTGAVFLIVMVWPGGKG